MKKAESEDIYISKEGVRLILAKYDKEGTVCELSRKPRRKILEQEEIGRHTDTAILDLARCTLGPFGNKQTQVTT